MHVNSHSDLSAYNDLNVHLELNPLSLSICNIILILCAKDFQQRKKNRFFPFLTIYHELLTQVFATKSMTIYHSEQNQPDKSLCVNVAA